MKKKFERVSSSGFVPQGQTSKLVSVTLVVTLLIAAMVSSGSLVYVAYASPGSTAYLEEGIFPGAPSYTVWVEGLTYYAKDANGHIPTWGITSNATQIIENVFDGLTNGRLYQEVVAFKGEFTYSVKIRIPSYTFLDWSAARFILDDNSDTNMFENEDSSNTQITIFGGFLEGNKDNQGAGEFHGIFFTNCTECKIINTVVSNVHGRGITLYLSNNNYITGVKVTGSGGIAVPKGINIDQGSYNVISNVFVSDIASGAKGIFINSGSLADALQNKIIGATVENCNGFGIALEGTTGQCLRNIVSSCTVRTSNLDNINVMNAPETQILGCNALDSTVDNGIVIYNYSDYSIVDGCFSRGNGLHGILIHDSNYVTISNNIVLDNGQDSTAYGITIHEDVLTAKYNIISDNWARDTQGSKTQDWGIYEDSTDYNVIVGNICRDNNVGGIWKVGANTKVNLCWNGTTWVS